MSGTRVYVGNLPMDIRTREVEDIFYKYGRIRDIDVKFPSRPPAFAFVDFEDARDAEDAIRGRDGYDYDGARLRVEPANGGRRDSGRDAGRGSARYPRNIRGTGDFTVEISNLPPRVSWQDLKDFMRKVGDVVFTEVDGRGGGIVEYSNKRDMQYAVEKLDDTEFRGRSENSFVRVRLAGRGRSNSRSNSRSRSRSRSSARRSSKKRSRSRSEGERDGEKKAKRSASLDKEPEKEKDADDQKEAGDQKDGKAQEADAAAASANDQKDDVKEEPKKEQLVEAEPEKKEDEPKKEEQAEVEKEAEAPKDEAPKDEAPKDEAPKEEAPKEA